MIHFRLQRIQNPQTAPRLFARGVPVTCTPSSVGLPTERCIHTLPLTSEAAALHLTEGLGARKESHNTDNGHGRQQLEEVPNGVIGEESALEGHERPEKHRVRDGGCAKGLGGVVEVATKEEPLYRGCVLVES